MRCVGLGAVDRIVLMDPAQETVQRIDRAAQGMGADPLDVGREDVEKIVERALLEGQRAVHVGFAAVEAGIDDEAMMQSLVVQSDDDASPPAIPDTMTPAGGVDDRQIAFPDDPFREPGKQHATCSPLRPSIPTLVQVVARHVTRSASRDNSSGMHCTTRRASTDNAGARPVFQPTLPRHRDGVAIRVRAAGLLSSVHAEPWPRSASSPRADCGRRVASTLAGAAVDRRRGRPSGADGGGCPIEKIGSSLRLIDQQSPREQAEGADPSHGAAAIRADQGFMWPMPRGPGRFRGTSHA